MGGKRFLVVQVEGLNIDPEAIPAHQSLRDISMKRKASGGKAIGMLAAMKLKRSKDEKEAMLNAEKLLAYDPGNTDHMLTLVESAVRGGYYDTVMWIGAILLRANADSQKPDFNKYIKLKNAYMKIGRADTQSVLGVLPQSTVAGRTGSASAAEVVSVGKKLTNNIHLTYEQGLAAAR